MSYGYNSDTAFSKAVTDIEDESRMLLDRLNNERLSDQEKARPVVFVAHSLGGIVVKKVLPLHQFLNAYVVHFVSDSLIPN
jgi:predicted alpha/beta hydrolase family esterase